MKQTIFRYTLLGLETLLTLPYMRFCTFGLACSSFLAALLISFASSTDNDKPAIVPDAGFEKTVKPILTKYCLECHSTKAKKGSLDLERFSKIADVRKDVRAWQNLIEQIETAEMPPKGKPQLAEEEKKQLLDWVRGFLEAEARARTGDPGKVPLRRLSNAEYDATIHDLTGVNLRPTREFPADGAGGEGFTNAGESLTDISPALFTRYLQTAKVIADHAVLLPDGFRFSPSKTRRDWTDEGTARLRKYYSQIWPGRDGSLQRLQHYLLTTVRQREALATGQFEMVAVKEALNAKYLRILWHTLNDKTPSEPLDAIRSKWRKASENDVADIFAEVKAWQATLWKTARIGNYVRSTDGKEPVASSALVENLSRQVALDPPPAEAGTLRLPIKLAPAQSEVTLYLAGRESGPAGLIVWHRPRFEGTGKTTLLLSEYATFGPAFEADVPSVFAKTATYLSAVAELAHATNTSSDTIAKKHGLDPAFLKQWAEFLVVVPQKEKKGEAVLTAATLTLLDSKTDPSHQGAIRGWTKKGADLPVVIANSSERTLKIPGRIGGRKIAVHPTPQEFVAVVWKSPLAGSVSITARVTHAHPNCGNGVAWQLEQRRDNRATLLGEGVLDLGQEAKPALKAVQVEKGDLFVLLVDPREGNHFCDLTEVDLTIIEQGNEKRTWDLAQDVAWDLHEGNPHADKKGHSQTWSFTRGPVRKPASTAAKIPSLLVGNSVLGRWRLAAADPGRRTEADQLAKEVEKILTGPRPKENDVERTIYDRLVTFESPLFTGVDLSKIAKRASKGTFGLPKERFASGLNGLVEPSDKVVEIRLPASLFVGREFVVDAKFDKTNSSRFVRVRAAVTPPDASTRWNGALLAGVNGTAYQQMLAGNAAFRRVFPLFTCFPDVVPTDEVVTLKMFHREDEPLLRLFATEQQARELDRLWAELKMISRQPLAEYDYLPQFIGFTTQDTSKAFQQFFVDRQPVFKRAADEFLRFDEAAFPRQMEALFAFAEKAYRRPLEKKDQDDLRSLYAVIRKKGADHNEAFRGVLTRVLASPAFLFRIEEAPRGKEPAPVSDWELATRLSYFLWSSLPDEELRKLAADNKLRQPRVLAEQTQRMLKDPRTRALAIEFGTQWIHVRGIDELKEKNEKLFPTFDAKLRQAIYEESILFFQDFFQNDQPVLSLLDANHTFVNEALAKHYGIPGIKGSEWRKVEGIRNYGRGGILGLASVHAKQSGASRTSPVLRGNWVVETLLGEKLPRPPANVPILPDQEGTDKLTTRQMVEKHVSNPSCAACHVRIDPFGFAFENFDAIGRWRVKELNGHPVDTKAKLKDGTEFEGIDGLRRYLLTRKKDVFVRLFCQKLLGYSLGRATTLSDTALIDAMVTELNKNDGRISAAVLTIIRSPQFRLIRGRDAMLD